MTRAEREGSGAIVETAGGRIRAGAVVLASGGRLGAVPALRRRLTTTSSHMVITEPVPDYLERIGWTGGECITDSRAMVNYFRTTPDGRIAFGWGGGRVGYGPAHRRALPRSTRSSRARSRRHLLRFFPGLEGRRIPLAWGGPVDVSPSHLPVVGSLDGPVHYGFGYTGNGVGPVADGRALARLARARPPRRGRRGSRSSSPSRCASRPSRSGSSAGR